MNSVGPQLNSSNETIIIKQKPSNSKYHVRKNKSSLSQSCIKISENNLKHNANIQRSRKKIKSKVIEKNEKASSVAINLIKHKNPKDTKSKNHKEKIDSSISRSSTPIFEKKLKSNAHRQRSRKKINSKVLEKNEKVNFTKEYVESRNPNDEDYKDCMDYAWEQTISEFKDNDINYIISFLKDISSNYLTSNLKEANIQKQLIKDIKNAIILDSEFIKEKVKKTISENFNSPSSTLILFYILEFLKKQQINSKDFDLNVLKEFANDIEEYLNSFLMFIAPIDNIQGNTKNFPQSTFEKFLNKAMKHYFLTKISKLEKNSKVVLPGGWFTTSKIKGHFMIYLLEKKDENMFLKTRINAFIDGRAILPQLIEQENITLEQVNQFIPDLVDLLTPFFLEEKIKDLSEVKKDRILFSTCHEYSEIDILPIFLQVKFSQENSKNCCFKACKLLLLFIFLNQNKVKSSEKEEFKKGMNAVKLFEKEFLKFLNKKLILKDESLEKKAFSRTKRLFLFNPK